MEIAFIFQPVTIVTVTYFADDFSGNGRVGVYKENPVVIILHVQQQNVELWKWNRNFDPWYQQ